MIAAERPLAPCGRLTRHRSRSLCDSHRWRCDAIGRRMPTLGVFAAILDNSGRILCVRMNYATRAWTTPGGRVEPGESPLDALKREVLEESGLDVVAGA